MKPRTDWALVVAIVCFAAAGLGLVLGALGAFMALILGGPQ